MSDDRGTPGTTSQAEEWRARARRNREEAERKRRRALDTHGGISVSEMLARHAAEQQSSEPGRTPRSRRRAAEDGTPAEAAASSPRRSRHSAPEPSPEPPSEPPSEAPVAEESPRARFSAESPAPATASPPAPASVPSVAPTPAPPLTSAPIPPAPVLPPEPASRRRPAPSEPPHATPSRHAALPPPEPAPSGHFPLPDAVAARRTPPGHGRPDGRPDPRRPHSPRPDAAPSGRFHRVEPGFPDLPTDEPEVPERHVPERPRGRGAPPAQLPQRAPQPPLPPPPHARDLSAVLETPPRRLNDTPPPPSRIVDAPTRVTPAVTRPPAVRNGDTPPNEAPAPHGRTAPNGTPSVGGAPEPNGAHPHGGPAPVNGAAAPETRTPDGGVSQRLPLPGAEAAEFPAGPPAAPGGRAAPPGANGQAPPKPRRRPRPPKDERSLEDRLTMTDQLEPVGDATKYRRKIDESLARFSAAHDELEQEERQRRQKRQRFFDQTMTALQRVVPVGRTGRRGGPTHERDGEVDPSEVVSSAETPSAEDTTPAQHSPSTEVTDLDDIPAPSPQHRILAGRASLVVMATLVFFATGLGWGAKTWFEGQFNEIAALDQNSDDIRKATAQLGDENFLIIGSDTREGAKTEDNVGTAADIEGARSDTVMLAHVPEDRERAVVISFPRDLEITRPECRRWDSTTGEYSDVVPAADAVKLNSAFNIGGPRCMTKVIQQLSGMKINHFVGIDFHGFKGMVDAVDGVTVHFDEPMRDAELGLIVAETGDVLLKGDQALNFVRARKVYGDPTFSDYGRMQRQQQFLSALLSKVMSSDVLLDVGRLSGFVQAFARSTFGENIGVEQMMTLAQSMRGMDAGEVVFLTVPTVGEANERGNEVLLEQDTLDLFEALIENTQLPGEEPGPADGSASGVEAGSETSQRAAAPVPPPAT